MEIWMDILLELDDHAYFVTHQKWAVQWWIDAIRSWSGSSGYSRYFAGQSFKIKQSLYFHDD